ncbi:MAG: hypothetical protein JO251_20180 [Verrucomicrobia bacterium]|nr:hypothetical protein [Verrucomicrobiota bacterium]
MIESNDSFGPVEFGYYPVGAGSYWYTKWYPYDPPHRGFKIHVSPKPQDAEIVARSVLPKLRELSVCHKVVRDLKIYMEQMATLQRGKFITVYTDGANQGQRVLDKISPELRDLRLFGGLRRGLAPTTRESNHREYEIAVGGSDLVFTRWYEPTDQD